MVTQDELRHALRDSVERAADETKTATRSAVAAHNEALDGRPVDLADIVPIGSGRAAGSGRPRVRRVLVSAAAAAVVAGVAIGAVTTTDGAQRDRAAASNGAPVSPDGHVPVDVSKVVSRIHVGASEDFVQDLTAVSRRGFRYQHVNGQTYDSNSVTSVDLVPSGEADFDPDVIPRDHPVRIAGTTGYLCSYQVHRGAVAKAKANVVAFRNRAGDWVFVSVTRHSAKEQQELNPRKIAAAYAALKVTFGDALQRVAVRTGWLPGGVRFGSLVRDGGLYPRPRGFNTVLLQGPTPSRYLEIEVHAHRSPQQDSGIVVVSRRIHGVWVSVVALGYDKTVAQRVLRTVRLASKPTDATTYWTIRKGLG